MVSAARGRSWPTTLAVGSHNDEAGGKTWLARPSRRTMLDPSWGMIVADLVIWQTVSNEAGGGADDETK